jgi:hypothetical protein
MSPRFRAGRFCSLAALLTAVALGVPFTAHSQPAQPKPAGQPAAPAPAAKPAAQPKPEAKPAAGQPAAAGAPAKPGQPATPAAATPTTTTSTPAAPRAPGGGANAPALAAACGARGGVIKTGAPKAPVNKGAPPPPPPTAAQLKALKILEDEAKEYQSGAKEFKDTLTKIVRHHYEERRRRVLSALDREISVEKRGLEDARDLAIKRLEEFIARYSGENAHPEATPDAMFRLAALYEERGRSRSEGELAAGLEPAIGLYNRIIREYPKYEEIAAVHYYLGHAYTDANRLEEGQQAWRALVCSNKYTVKPDPKDAGKSELQPLPQDHDDKFWIEWQNAHPIPLDQGGAKRGAVRGRAAAKGGVGAKDAELSYVDPYPPDCQPIAQATETGEEPRYLAEIWWQLGNWHFDQIDPRGGPYNLNRAVSAYQHSLEFKKPPIYGVSLYKLAWTYFKQQRYKTAVDWFVKLLHHADELEAKTGDPGADFRAEAYTYIAGSLTYVDFEGPPPEHPYVPRNDVLDVETNPLVAEEKMAIALQRIQDPQLIPQDKKWTVEIYKSLAQEFIEITQNRNAIAMLQLTLQKFPMNRDAPVMQNKVAELYDQLARLAPEGSAAKAEYSSKALEARTKLANYVGTTPWTDANRDDAEALQQAELLVRGGLKRAAADHTNAARAEYQKALELSDPEEQKRVLSKAIDEYRMAETGWAGYIEQDPQAMDGYESRFWLADARYWVVVLQVTVGRSPTAPEVNTACTSAVAVRDSNEDDKYMQPAGYYAVTVAERLLEDEYRKYDESNGAQGIEKRDEVRFTGEGDSRKHITDPIPPAVQTTIQARDEYVARVPPERDPHKNGLLYQIQAGDYYFVYGHFDKAKARYMPVYDAECGKSPWGYRAYEKLLDIAAFEGNEALSEKLTKGKVCAITEEDKAKDKGVRGKFGDAFAYRDAAKAFKEAEAMPDGPARNAKWREAAAKYRVALERAPDRDDAPEGAINGAYAYKQVGEYDKAIGMYELFISKYGSEKILQTLKNGDLKAQPPKPPEPKKYEDRVGYLKTAYDALAGSYVLFFNYPKAAETFDKISGVEHFKTADRRESAKQALQLYASLGDRQGLERTRRRFEQLGASPKEVAEADYIIATAELKKWDQYSADEGANQNARRNAQRAMDDYYARYQKKDAAAEYLVRSAYFAAKTRKAAKQRDADEWWRKTIAAFEVWRRLAPNKDGKSSALGSAEAGMAAEAEFTMLDEEITQKFDYESGHHHYKGTPVQVVNEYKADAVVAKQYYDRLQRIVDYYVSPEWATAAVARQGTLYDSLRTGLYNARPPDLVMFDKKQEALLKKAEESGNPDLQEKADAVRVQVQQAWRDRREKELDSADRVMVDRYSTAIVLARRYNVSNPAVTRAIRRLAFHTDTIGEAKMKQYTTGVKDLNYTEGMFPRMRPGMVTAPQPQGMPNPLPVLAQ